MKPAAVAVIGGGVMGASAGYHLAARGRRDIVILDRADGPGAGSTGRATGGYRAQYGTPINVRLSLLARDKLLRFEEETGVDPGYLQAGYLWLAVNQAELAALDAGRRVQHAEGLLEAASVTPGEVARLNPAIRLEGIVGGAYCPTDGFIRPLRILEGYLASAARLGARVEWGVEVTGLRRAADGRITEVGTSRGPIAVEAVVNAAGPWAAAVGEMAAIALPVTPLRRQIAATAPCDLLPADMPMTIWAGDGFHLRVRDGRVLLLWPTPGAPGRPFDASVDPAWIDAVTAMAHARVPVLREAVVDRARAGPVCTRCRRTSTRFSAQRPSARTFTSSTALPGTGSCTPRRSAIFWLRSYATAAQRRWMSAASTPGGSRAGELNVAGEVL